MSLMSDFWKGTLSQMSENLKLRKQEAACPLREDDEQMKVKRLGVMRFEVRFDLYSVGYADGMGWIEV